MLSNQSGQSFCGEVSLRVDDPARSTWVPRVYDPLTGKVAAAPVWRREGAQVVVGLTLDPAGSLFVVVEPGAVEPAFAAHEVLAAEPPAALPGRQRELVIRSATYGVVSIAPPHAVEVTTQLRGAVRNGRLRSRVGNQLAGDPAPGTAKNLLVEYSVGGVLKSAKVAEGQMLELPRAGEAGEFKITGAVYGQLPEALKALVGGTAATVTVAAPPPPQVIDGGWQVAFEAQRGTPAALELGRLVPLHEHADPGVRYFSGTATYRTTFDVPAGRLGAGGAVFLDLGRVCVIAGVKLNGADLGILWRDPFRTEVTGHLKPGSNTLEVAVANLWVNRLVGDEQLPPGVEWEGPSLARWPEWFIHKQPRPSARRITFTTWHHWKKDDPLPPSGLIGPVALRFATVSKPGN